MSGMNKVILIGRLGADPEVRMTQSGQKIANLRLATSESWRDKQTGERREKTEWHRVVIFNENTAKVAEQYLKKGSLCAVEGSLQTRKWQAQDGSDRYSTEVVIANFNGKLTLLDSKKDGGNEQSTGTNSMAQAAGFGSGTNTAAKPADGFDDEIPF